MNTEGSTEESSKQLVIKSKKETGHEIIAEKRGEQRRGEESSDE